MPTVRPFLGALGFVLACEAVGLTGAAVTNPGSDWYRALEKPPFQPPAWVFGPAWTLLYGLMGLAAWRVWRRRASPAARRALVLFGAQLAVNAAWSPVFFGAHAVGAALAILVVLTGLVAWTVAAFRRVDRPAAALLLPYLAWLSFATVLNAEILRRNG
jgi:tryptophan-rich sensory protein